MDAYNTIADMIKSLKKDHLTKSDFENDKMIEKIVHDSDIFPEEEKEYMFEFMIEEKNKTTPQSEIG